MLATKPATQDTIEYAGPPDAVCLITLAPLAEIELPVAFRASPAQPYEARALARWLEVRRVEPLTNRPVVFTHSASEAVAPLAGLCKDVPRAAAMLGKRPEAPWGDTITEAVAAALYAALMLAWSVGPRVGTRRAASLSYEILRLWLVVRRADMLGYPLCYAVATQAVLFFVPEPDADITIYAISMAFCLLLCARRLEGPPPPPPRGVPWTRAVLAMMQLFLYAYIMVFSSIGVVEEEGRTEAVCFLALPVWAAKGWRSHGVICAAGAVLLMCMRPSTGMAVLVYFWGFCGVFAMLTAGEVVRLVAAARRENAV